MTQIGVFAVTHKQPARVKPAVSDFPPMCVGHVKSDLPPGPATDEVTQPHIAFKNKHYSELTALYQIINADFNRDYDVIGLVHYRRVFLMNTGLGVKLIQYLMRKNRDPYHWGYHVISKYELQQKDVATLIERGHDVILPRKWKYTRGSLFNQYQKTHEIKYLLLCKEIIEKNHPDYLPAFEQAMGIREGYFFNMIIGKKQVVSDYGHWLFSVLFALEKLVKLDELAGYEVRLFGFLSERLMNVYFIHHAHLKIKELDVVLYSHL